MAEDDDTSLDRNWTRGQLRAGLAAAEAKGYLRALDDVKRETFKTIDLMDLQMALFNHVLAELKEKVKP
jgi:hypothetical protein